tara:strand:- start:171 stop:1400 length:1230 start_codon:yes stop_codon:yes gene_type:complete
MNIIKPPFTGDPTLDSWTNQITQALNMGLLLPGIQGQTGGVGSSGPTGNTAIYLYQRTTVNNAPSRPTTVVYDYTDINNVTITANNGWSGAVPTTGGKYLWITFRYISNLEDTITDSNTWNTVVLLSEDGNDGNDGAPAPRSLSRRVYYSSSSGAPSAPTATVTWSTLVLSGLATGWSETAPTASATSTTLIYFSDLIFTDDTGVATTSSDTGSTPIEGTSFSGIVTFDNGDFALDGNTVTGIDGSNLSDTSITGGKLASTNVITASAQISNLVVGTAQIANDAVSNKFAAFTGASIIPTATYQLIEDISITASGNLTSILFNCGLNGANSVQFDIRLDTVSQRVFNASSGFYTDGTTHTYHEQMITLAMTLTPTVGTRVVSVYARLNGGSPLSPTIQNRYLETTELKK